MLVFKTSKQPVVAPAFNPDGTRLAVVRYKPGPAEEVDTPVQLLDVFTGTLAVCGPPVRLGIAGQVRFDPSGRWLLMTAGYTGLVAVNLRTGASADPTTFGWGRAVFEMAVAPSGDCVVVYEAGYGDSGRLIAHKLTAKGIGAVRWDGLYDGFGGLAFFPDAKRLALVEYRTVWDAQNFKFLPPQDVFLRTRSAANGELLDESRFEGDGQIPRCPDGLALSPDGKWAAFLSLHSAVLRPTADPAKSFSLPNPNRKHLTGMAFHPSGRYLAVTSNDATVRLHDRDADWSVTRTFDWDIGKLKSVVFSPEGNLAAAGSESGKVVVWDVDV